MTSAFLFLSSFSPLILLFASGSSTNAPSFMTSSLDGSPNAQQIKSPVYTWTQEAVPLTIKMPLEEFLCTETSSAYYEENGDKQKNAKAATGATQSLL